jgi:phosphoribosylamine---glycine ligase
MKVLIIGSGGREHCLAWKISKSDFIDKIYAIPGNPGINSLAECLDIPVTKDKYDDILNFVKEKGIDLTVIGPELPLVDGIVDYFNSKGHKIFGPEKKASMLEGSKVFTKNLCKKYRIPTADGEIFIRKDYERALKYIKQIDKSQFPIVIKADGLAAGKGVIIADSKEQAEKTVKDIFINNVFGSSGDTLIIENFIKGFEVSILNLCDGRDIIPLVLAKDYKKIFNGDKGKNTGGMGSYSPVPFIDDKLLNKILNNIIYQTYNALLKEGIKYKGILYGGIIVSEGDPYLLEYNCRFGDPETQAILPRLESDLLEILMKCVDGNLGSSSLRWSNNKCVCVIAASSGYPESSSSGDIIKGLEVLENSDDVLVFHSGTRISNGNLVTNGGRVLGLVSCSKSFKQSRQNIYRSLENIKFKGMQYRKDIALRVEEK